MKKLLFLLTLLFTTLLSCSKDNNSSADSDHGNTNQSDFMISSYIRGSFYNRGRISEESMNACTDLICLGDRKSVV